MELYGASHIQRGEEYKEKGQRKEHEELCASFHKVFVKSETENHSSVALSWLTTGIILTGPTSTVLSAAVHVAHKAN